LAVALSTKGEAMKTLNDALSAPKIHIPTLEELRASVQSRPADPALEPITPVADDPDRTGERILSREAEAFLRDAAAFIHMGSSLEEHFTRAGITSGSVKKRVIQELVSRGLIRLEHKGRSKQVHLYGTAWEYLGMEPPAGRGAGGSTHRHCIEHVARLFRARGYDVRVECPVGPRKKRVDLLALGKKRIGIEIGLSSPAQELRNIEEDLASGVLDMVVFCALDETMLEDVRKRVAKHPKLERQLARIRFYLLDLEDGE
jgi:hypothetical protein